MKYKIKLTIDDGLGGPWSYLIETDNGNFSPNEIAIEVEKFVEGNIIADRAGITLTSL